jgi:hypothetical protein
MPSIIFPLPPLFVCLLHVFFFFCGFANSIFIPCLFVCLFCYFIAAGEVLQVSDPLLDQKIHPSVIVRGYTEALEFCVQALNRIAVPVDINQRAELSKIIQSCLGTKFVRRSET